MPDVQLEERNRFGATSPKSEHTVLTAVTVLAGDLVKIDATTGNLELVAANGTAALGWAINGAVAGATCQVLEARHGVQVLMAISGASWAATMKYHNYALAGSTGAFTCNLGEAGHDLFKVVEYDSTKTKVWVEILAAASEAEEVEPV